MIHYYNDVDIYYYSMKNVGVFVYGDIGRSPRMQNHAIQLGKMYQVYFMGFFQTAPKSKIIENQHIKLIDIQIKNLQYIRAVSFYLYAVVRIILQVLQIFYLLGWKYRNLDFVLMQNPPSIPNLFAIWFTSLFAKYQIYIDFHNYGYTILNLNIKNRLIIKFAEYYEKIFAKRANRFFCVSNAMKKDLKDNWNIQATTLYDRPLQKQKLTINKNLFLQKYNQKPLDQNDLLLVSSTSWTKDEDFSILLDALEMYDKSGSKKFIRTFITGKGPQKQRYLKEIEAKKSSWKSISVDAIWLQADDYPVLLSICDLGVCLHYSSSGLDLPMKVVDMFGSGIPVLAIQFQALPELVKNGQNGFTFKTAEELFKRIQEISQNDSILKGLKQKVIKQMKHTWEKQWQEKVSPSLTL